MTFHRRGQNLLSLSQSADSDYLLQALNQANYTINEQTLIIEQYERRFAQPSTLRAQQLEKQLQAAQRRSQRQEQDIIFLSESHDRLRAEYLSILHTKNELQKSLRESTSNVYPENEEQATQIVDLNKQIRELSSLKIDLNNQLKQNAVEIKTLKRQLDEEKLTQRDYEEEIMRNKAEASNLAAQLAASEKEKTDGVAEIGVLYQKITNLEAKTRAEGDKNEQLYTQIANLNYQIATYNQSMAQNDGKLKDEQHKLYDTENQVQLKTQEIQFLKGQQDVQQRQITALNERILKQNDLVLAKRQAFQEVLEKLKVIENKVASLSASVSNGSQIISELLPYTEALAVTSQQMEEYVGLQQHLEAELTDYPSYEHVEERPVYEQQLDERQEGASKQFSEDDFSENVSPKAYEEELREATDGFSTSASVKHEQNASDEIHSEKAAYEQEVAVEASSQEAGDEFDEDIEQPVEDGYDKRADSDRDLYPGAYDGIYANDEESGQSNGQEADSFEYTHSAIDEAETAVENDYYEYNVVADLDIEHYDGSNEELADEEQNHSIEALEVQAKAYEIENADALSQAYKQEEVQSEHVADDYVSDDFSQEEKETDYRLEYPEVENETSQSFEKEKSVIQATEEADSFSSQPQEQQENIETSQKEEIDAELDLEGKADEDYGVVEDHADVQSYDYDAEEPDGQGEEQVKDEPEEYTAADSVVQDIGNDATNALEQQIETEYPEEYQQAEASKDEQEIEDHVDEKPPETDSFSEESEQQHESYKPANQEDYFEEGDAGYTTPKQRDSEIEADAPSADDQPAEVVYLSEHAEEVEQTEEMGASAEQPSAPDQKPESDFEQDGENLPYAYEYLEIITERTYESERYSAKDESYTHTDASKDNETSEEYIGLDGQPSAEGQLNSVQDVHDTPEEDDNGPVVQLVAEEQEEQEHDKAEAFDTDAAAAQDLEGPAATDVDEYYEVYRSYHSEEPDVATDQRPSEFSAASYEDSQAHDEYLAAEEVSKQEEEAHSDEGKAFSEVQDDVLDLNVNTSGAPEVVEQVHEPEMPEQEDSLTTSTPNGAEISD